VYEKLKNTTVEEITPVRDDHRECNEFKGIKSHYQFRFQERYNVKYSKRTGDNMEKAFTIIPAESMPYQPPRSSTEEGQKKKRRRKSGTKGQ
jgi:hypothetical protein